MTKPRYWDNTTTSKLSDNRYSQSTLHIKHHPQKYLPPNGNNSALSPLASKNRMIRRLHRRSAAIFGSNWRKPPKVSWPVTGGYQCRHRPCRAATVARPRLAVVVSCQASLTVWLDGPRNLPQRALHGAGRWEGGGRAGGGQGQWMQSGTAAVLWGRVRQCCREVWLLTK